MGIRLSDDEAWGVVTAAHTGILTSLRRDGAPIALPVWFVADAERIYVGTPTQAKKVTRIRNDDRVSFLVESGEAWVELSGVHVTGRATVLDPERDAHEIARANELIDAKYAEFRPKSTRMPSATKKHYSKSVLIRLDPVGRLLTWDNSRMTLRTD